MELLKEAKNQKVEQLKEAKVNRQVCDKCEQGNMLCYLSLSSCCNVMNPGVWPGPHRGWDGHECWVGPGEEGEGGGGHPPLDLLSGADSVRDLDEVAGLDRGRRSVDHCDQSRRKRSQKFTCLG